jgi:hypothetical protein
MSQIAGQLGVIRVVEAMQTLEPLWRGVEKPEA